LLFYSLFQSTPSIFFELIGRPPTESQGYRFESVEVKQTAFRLDGVFLPPEDQPNAPLHFLEVQFQRDSTLYRRVFSEVFLYLKQHLHGQRWQAAIVYPSAAIEAPEPLTFGELMSSSYVQVVYLDQLGPPTELSPGLAILRLIVEPESSVPEAARTLIERVQQSPVTTTRSQLIELMQPSSFTPFPIIRVRRLRPC
jgi:predicted transposase/invertase (TIGR01784 family)